MKMTRKMKGLIAVAVSTVVGLAIAGVASAATEPVVAEVQFVNPVSLAENFALRFGKIDEAFANLETITIAPDSTVSGDTGRIAGGTQGAADITVTADTSVGITILVDNVSSNTGYALATFICNYDGGSDTACDGSGYSTTSSSSATAPLLIGATITGDGNAGVGTFNGSFDVTVLYQ